MGGLSTKVSSVFSYFIVLLAALVAALSVGGIVFGYQKNGVNGIWFFLFLLLFSLLSVWHFARKARGSAKGSPDTDAQAAIQTSREEMGNRQIKKEVARMMKDGVGKTKIFRTLVGKGAEEKMAAHYIASYPDERLGFEHEGKVKFLITIMFIQAFLVFFVGYVMGMGMQVQYPWLIGIMFAIVPLLFVWGFYKQSAMAYNAYLFLTIIQSPKLFKGFSETPIETAIGLVITLGTLWLVLYIRSKLFPDFAVITPKKVKGRYVFSS